PPSVSSEATSHWRHSSNRRMVRSIPSRFTDDDPAPARAEINAAKDARIALDHVDGAVLVILVGYTHPAATFVGRPDHALRPIHRPREEDGRILGARGRLAEPHAVALLDGDDGMRGLA